MTVKSKVKSVVKSVKKGVKKAVAPKLPAEPEPKKRKKAENVVELGTLANATQKHDQQFLHRASHRVCVACLHKHEGLPFCNIFRTSGQLCGCTSRDFS